MEIYHCSTKLMHAGLWETFSQEVALRSKKPLSHILRSGSLLSQGTWGFDFLTSLLLQSSAGVFSSVVLISLTVTAVSSTSELLSSLESSLSTIVSALSSNSIPCQFPEYDKSNHVVLMILSLFCCWNLEQFGVWGQNSSGMLKANNNMPFGGTKLRETPTMKAWLQFQRGLMTLLGMELEATWMIFQSRI